MSETFANLPSIFVYKIVARSDWESSVAANSFKSSADDARDGFIHLSSAHQIAATLARHFAGQDGLMLVAFNSNDLALRLKWERSRGGDLFPHYYGEMPVGLALWAKPLRRIGEGIFILDEDQA